MPWLLRRIHEGGLFRDLRFWLAVLALTTGILKILIIPYPWPELPPTAYASTPVEDGKLGFVFDEAHYVPAARKMLMGQAANNEHPPLSKVLIMLGMLILGDNPYGWRTLITLCGAASIYLLGLLAYELTGNAKLSFISALLFALDVSSFNLSSMAILDAPALMFSLLGAFLFLRRRLVLSGISFGLALLSKASTLLILVAILVYALLEKVCSSADLRSAFKEWTPTIEKVGLVAAAVMLAGLAVYDYGYGAFSTPFGHLDYILSYHSSLVFSEGDVVNMPLTWTNPFDQFPKIPYFVVSVKVNGKEYHPIAYYGMQTPLWWTTWAVAAFCVYHAYLELRRGLFPRTELFVLCWFMFSYLVYFPLAHLLRRWVYPFYFCMTVPLIAVGLPKILEGDKFSEGILYGLLIVQALWFLIYFPVKPMWLIDFLSLFGAPV